MRKDYARLQTNIARAFEYDSYHKLISDWYLKESMSTIEISERIYQITEISITPRSIQRHLAKMNIIRPGKEAFNLAIQRGRVQWAYKDNKIKRKPVPRAKRFAILSRDGFKCVLCGATAATSILETDHIIPVCKGGDNSDANLRTLCVDCNIGKRVFNQER